MFIIAVYGNSSSMKSLKVISFTLCCVMNTPIFERFTVRNVFFFLGACEKPITQEYITREHVIHFHTRDRMIA